MLLSGPSVAALKGDFIRSLIREVHATVHTQIEDFVAFVKVQSAEMTQQNRSSSLSSPLVQALRLTHRGCCSICEMAWWRVIFPGKLFLKIDKFISIIEFHLKINFNRYAYPCSSFDCMFVGRALVQTRRERIRTMIMHTKMTIFIKRKYGKFVSVYFLAITSLRV
jgi:hypothetical protein